MINTAPIYSNPVIDDGLYHAKVTDVHYNEDPASAIRVTLRLAPFYDEFSGRTLFAVIYPTEKGRTLLNKFMKTFGVVNNDYSTAVEKWGCISLFQNTYQGTKFSNVNFVRQTQGMRQKSTQLEYLDQQGSLDWAA